MYLPWGKSPDQPVAVEEAPVFEGAAGQGRGRVWGGFGNQNLRPWRWREAGRYLVCAMVCAIGHWGLGLGGPFLLETNLVSSLGAWKIHHDALQSRLEFKKEMERKWREEDLPVVPAPIAATAAPAAASVATTGPVEVATQAEAATSTSSGPRRSERGRKN